MWVDDFMVMDAVAWARVSPGIIWFDHVAFGHRVAELGRFPYYGGGNEASRAILGEYGKRTIVASIAAHGTGKNLQVFNRNLITTMPANDGVMEQLVGRTHRQGQLKDVTVDFYSHTKEEIDALVSARSQADYVRQTTGALHKLTYCRWL